MPAQHKAPKGTLDILPPGDGGAPFDSAAFAALVGRFVAQVERAGFGLIVGPMFEDVSVYARVGATTDIVRKEMYDFDDKATPPRHLALRPDSTPSVVRAYVEHRPNLPWRVWYLAPHFRYDQPQAGRYRQHHSLGVEVLGVADPELDAELIALVNTFLSEDVGLEHLELAINSIGDETCRPAYRQLLLDHLAARESDLCDQHREHWRDNPMRLFDCKRQPCRRATDEAPRLLDHLCDGCAVHFQRTTAGLDAKKIHHHVDTRLIRGQDYYNRTTFEFTSTSLDQAQLALGGGGRYDGFVEALGGPSTAGIGFGLGIERVLLAAMAEETSLVTEAANSPLDVFVIDTTAGAAHAAGITDALRGAGIRTDRAYDGRSYKAQFKAASRSRARLALVIEDAGWSIRTLTEKGEPASVDEASAVGEIRRRLESP